MLNTGQAANVLQRDSSQIAGVPAEEQLSGHLKAPSGKGTETSHAPP